MICHKLKKCQQLSTQQTVMLLGFVVNKHMIVIDTHDVVTSSQGRSRQSGWSGFGWTTISQDRNKIPFYRKQVINESTGVIFGLVKLVILQYGR